jgi:[acyl-carrier-protein] S-malonyltransferase
MIAFTFPGQGSQRPGAGAAWRDHPSWHVVEVASAATGRDVAHLLLDADAEELRATDNAQLSTYVASLLVLDAVRRGGLEASHLAGHSLGEYSALTAAGVLSIEDGARLVAERGRAMLDASRARAGTMAAVLGADDDAVEAACEEVRAGGLDAWVANYNAPGQVVVAGSAEGLDAAGAAAKARGAKRTMAVAVSGAFHTPYMAPAQEQLDRALGAARFGDAALPTVANVDGALHHRGSEWASLASRQLCSPVRWAQGLGTLEEAGVTRFVEIGPGTVLSGMAKRTVAGATTAAASTPDEVDQLVAAGLDATG